MAQLRTNPTIANTVTEHNNDHAQIHNKLNALSYAADADYSAVGNDSTDNTSAIQSAMTAANAVGGGVVTLGPGTFRCSSGLTFYSDVTLRGTGGPGGSSGTILKFTGTGSGRFIDGRSISNAKIEHLTILYSSASFTGTLLDLGGTAASPGSSHTLDHVYLGGASASQQTATLLRVNGQHTCSYNHVQFGHCNIAIQGLEGATSDDFANGLTFNSPFFAHYASAAIKQPGQGWTFNGGVGEPKDNGSPSGFIDSSDLTITVPQGFTWNGGWLGDVSATGSWVKWSGRGFKWNGGLIGLNNSSTFFQAMQLVYGVDIRGVRFSNSNPAYAMDFTASGASTSPSVNFMGCDYDAGLTIFKSGTIPPGSVYQDWRTAAYLYASGGITIGGGTAITKHLSGTKTWDPASVADGAMTSTTVTVTGAAIGNPSACGFSNAVPAGVSLTANVTATDTVTVTLTNHSGGAVDLASGTLRASVWQY